MAVRPLSTLKKPHLAFSKKLGQRHFVNKSPFLKGLLVLFSSRKERKNLRKTNFSSRKEGIPPTELYLCVVNGRQFFAFGQSPDVKDARPYPLAVGRISKHARKY